MCLVAWGSICSPAAHLGLGPFTFTGLCFHFGLMKCILRMPKIYFKYFQKDILTI